MHKGNFTNFKVISSRDSTAREDSYFLLTYLDEALYCKKSVLSSHDDLIANLADNGALQIGPQQAKVSWTFTVH